MRRSRSASRFRATSCRRPGADGASWAVALLAGLLAAAAAVAGGESATAAGGGPTVLGHPGYLVIEGARAGDGAFVWSPGPAAGLRSLVWSSGRLVVPDSCEVEDFGRTGVGVRCGAGLTGRGAHGSLVFADGIYPIDQPITLTDGVLTLELTAGELEIRGTRLRYLPARPEAAAQRMRADYLLLAGVLLAVMVLLRLARRQRSRSRP